jgi:hypothetical protein
MAISHLPRFSSYASSISESVSISSATWGGCTECLSRFESRFASESRAVLSGLRVAGLFEEDPPGLHSTPSFGSAHSVLSGLRLAGLFEEDPPGVHSTPSFGSASKLSKAGALLTSSAWYPTLDEPEICSSSTLASGCAGASMKAITKSVIPSQCEICSAGSRQFNLRSRRLRRNALRSDVLAG